MVELLSISLFDNKRGKFARVIKHPEPMVQKNELEAIRLKIQRHFKNKYGVYFTFKSK